MPEATYDPGISVHDLFGLMRDTFADNLWLVILYLVGCISLAYHLLHGFQSAWRSLGVSNSKYLRLINGVGIGFSIIVCVAFAMMPISIYFGWVQ
jgi:succinate dehydrogenase / fumarate reductase cytochrome b subunit